MAARWSASRIAAVLPRDQRARSANVGGGRRALHAPHWLAQALPQRQGPCRHRARAGRRGRARHAAARARRRGGARPSRPMWFTDPSSLVASSCVRKAARSAFRGRRLAWAGSGFGTPMRLLRAWAPRSRWLRAPAPETAAVNGRPARAGTRPKVGRRTDGLRMLRQLSPAADMAPRGTGQQRPP
jgi:hypothetical protein